MFRVTGVTMSPYPYTYDFHAFSLAGMVTWLRTHRVTHVTTGEPRP